MSTKHLLVLFLLCGPALTMATDALGQSQTQGTIPPGSYLPPEYAALAQQGDLQLAAQETGTSQTHYYSDACGLDLVLKHPATWHGRPVSAPVIQAFGPQDGGFSVELSCTPLGLRPGEILSAEKVHTYLTPEKVKATLPKFAVLEDTIPVRLDGHPAALALFSQPVRMGQEEHAMTSAAYYFISQGNLVILEGYYSAPDKAQLALRRASPQIAGMLALFHAMARGITIREKEEAGRPPQRLVDQFTQTFTTKGHPKTRDLEISLKYPATWTAAEGAHPHDVQVFSRPGTQDTITLSFIPAGPDAQYELYDQFEVYDLDKLLPPGAIFDHLRRLILFEKSAGMIIYALPPPQGGSTLHQRIRRIIVILGGTRVQLTCAVATADAAQAPQLAGRLAELTPLFLAMVDSIALLSVPVFSPDIPPLPPVSTQAQAALLPPDTSKTFTTKDHPKAQGTHISLRYPSTWTVREGGPPDVVQTFASPESGTYAHLSIGEEEIPNSDSLTEERVTALVDPEVWKKRVSPEATIIEARALTIHGRPASVITQIGVSMQGTKPKKFMMMSFQFVQGRRMSQFSGTIAVTPHDELFFSYRIRETAPVFRAIVDSIVLHEDGHVPSPPGSGSTTTVNAAAAELTQSFSTAGHAKARGITLSLKYPSAWTAEEGTSDGTVQAFSDRSSGDSVYLFFTPVDLLAGQSTPTVEQMKALLSEEGQKKDLPKTAVIRSIQPLTFNGQPACLLEWTDSVRDDAGQMHSRNLDFIFIQGATMVTLNGSVGTIDEAAVSQLPARMEARRPLFQAIANSIVVQGGTSAPANVIPAQRVRPAIPAETVTPAAAQEEEARMQAASLAFQAEGMAAWSQSPDSTVPPGLALTLQHPRSWLHLQPERPGYIQEFRSPSAGFDLGLVLVPTAAFYGRAMTEAEIAAYLTPEKIATFMPDEVEFISARAFQFQGQPACEVRCTQPREKGGVMLTDVITALFFIRDQTMVNLDGILTTADKAEVPRLLQKLDDLRAPVRAIASTIVLHSSGGGAAPPAPATPAAPPPAAPATSGPAPASGMKTFSTKDHPKARGLNLSLQYPASWRTLKPYAPNGIQIFHPDGPYSIHLTAGPARLPDEAPLTEADATAMLTPAGIMRILPEGFTLIRGKQTTFSGKPACQVLCSLQSPKAGRGCLLFSGFFFIRHGILVTLRGEAINIPDAELSQHTQDLEAAMNVIIPTLEDHGGAPPPAPPAAPDTRRIFTTTGHPKAAGVRIRLKHPASWEPQESDDPQIIQRFQSPEKNVWAELFLGEEVPGTAPLTEEKIWDLLKPEDLKKDVAGTLTTERITISGMPATKLGFATYAPQVGPEAESRVGDIYHFIQQRRHLQLRLICSAQDKAAEKLIGYQLQQASGNDFYRMAYSLLPDEAAPPAIATTAAASRSLFQGPFAWPVVGVLAALGLCIPWAIHRRLKSSASTARPTASLPPHAPPIPGAAAGTSAGHSLNPKDTPLRPRLLHPPATTPQHNEAAEDHPAPSPAEPRVPSRAIRRAQPEPQPAYAADTPSTLITLWQGGETYGPYAIHDIISMWDAGQLAGNASYWRAGMPDYRPLAKDIQHLRTVVENGSV